MQTKTALHYCCKAAFYGADKQIRTADLILTKDALCLLSYTSIVKLRCKLLTNQIKFNTSAHYYTIKSAFGQVFEEKKSD